MRYDDFRRSDDIDDRRDDGGGGMGGGGGFGLPMGGGGLGIGTIIVLGLVGYAFGIDPRILIGGAEILTGGSQAPSYQTDRRSGAGQDRRADRRDGQHDLRRSRRDRRSLERDLQGQRAELYRAAHRAVPQRHQWRPLRHGAVGDGAVLLPAGQADLSRHQLLPRRSRPASAAARAAPASSPPAYIIAHEAGHHIQNLLGILPRVTRLQQQAGSKARSQRAAGQGRAAGRLPVRRLGQPRGEEAPGLPRGRRHRRGADRRRPRSATIRCSGRRRAGWCRIPSPTAPPRSASVVHDRLPAGHRAGLQYVWRGSVVVGRVPDAVHRTARASVKRC